MRLKLGENRKNREGKRQNVIALIEQKKWGPSFTFYLDNVCKMLRHINKDLLITFLTLSDIYLDFGDTDKLNIMSWS